MKIATSSLLLALSLPGLADTFILKDGTELDATILKKTSEEYELEVNVTKTIKERRTVKISDVEKIEKPSAADAAFEEEIAPLLPVPPFQDLAEYDARLNAIADFLATHKLTSAGLDAGAMMKELQAERDLIAKGGYRIAEGEAGMITADEYAADEIGIKSSIAAKEFEDLVAERSFLAGLRKYSEIERDFYGTKAQRSVLPLMRKLIATYLDLLNQDLDQIEEREEGRQTALSRLSEVDQQRAQQIEDRRKASFEELWEKEEADGQTWLSVDTKNVKSMESAAGALEEEFKRIDTVIADLDKMEATDELYRQAWIAAGEKREERLGELLAELDKVELDQSYRTKLLKRYDPEYVEPPTEETEETEMDEQPEESKKPEEDEKAEDDEQPDDMKTSGKADDDDDAEDDEEADDTEEDEPAEDDEEEELPF